MKSTISNTQVEKIEKLGEKFIEKQNKLLERASTAKSFKTYLEAQLRVIKFHKTDLTHEELVQVFENLIQKYKQFESIGISKIDSWKGKSSIQIIKKPDKIIVIKYQRPSKGEDPVPFRTEILKYELNAIITCINQINKKEIETKKIAEEYCRLLKIDRNDNNELLFRGFVFDWDRFFAWRKMHNKLNIILNVLDKEGLISYKGGITKVSEKKLNIQTIFS